eukprot:10273020-Heterocapsa_arctica.AAC.1
MKPVLPALPQPPVLPATAPAEPALSELPLGAGAACLSDLLGKAVTRPPLPGLGELPDLLVKPVLPMLLRLPGLPGTVQA